MSAAALTLLNQREIWSDHAAERLPALEALVGHLESPEEDSAFARARLFKALESPAQSSRLASASALACLAQRKTLSVMDGMEQHLQKFSTSTQRDQLLAQAFLLFAMVCSVDVSSDLSGLIDACAALHNAKAWLEDSAIFSLIHLLQRIKSTAPEAQALRPVLAAIKRSFYDPGAPWTAAKVALTAHLQWSLSVSYVVVLTLLSVRFQCMLASKPFSGGSRWRRLALTRRRCSVMLI
jgi:hypothetical protein